MRLPRVRFSIRMMMVAVAITAMILGLVERRARFMKIALAHQNVCGNLGVSHLELYLILLPVQGVSEEAYAKMEPLYSPLKQYVEYHNRMASKYELASGRPWLPVAPDPPRPCSPSLSEDLKARIAALLRDEL